MLAQFCRESFPQLFQGRRAAPLRPVVAFLKADVSFY